MNADADARLRQARTKRDGTVVSDERLAEVFKLVENPKGWKLPIDAWVPKDQADQEEIVMAVTWFAGGMPEVHDNGGSNVWYVSGAGYYAWIGA